MPDMLERLHKSKTLILILSAVILVFLFQPAFKIITDLPSYYHHQVFLFAWMLVFLVVFTWLAEKLESISGKSPVMIYVKWLGENVTAVYVIQWLIIGNIATAIYKTQGMMAIMMWFVAILLLSSVAAYLYNYIVKVIRR